MDDAACLRNLFLRAPLFDCLRIMSPELLAWQFESSTKNECNGKHDLTKKDEASAISTAPVIKLKELPMETLAMQSNKILLLDHHDRVFVWNGQEVCGEQFDHIRDAMQVLIDESIQNRLPTPTISWFPEGSSMARFFISRLIPSHKDPIDRQLETFPELRLLPPQELACFCSKFPQTDEQSFFHYYWSIMR